MRRIPFFRIFVHYFSLKPHIMAKKVHPLRLRLLSASHPSPVSVGQSTTAANVPAPKSVDSPSVPESKKSAKRRKSSVDVPEQSVG